MYDEAFCCRVDEAPRHEPTERLETAVYKPETVVPGHVYSTEGLKIAEQLFRGLLMIDGELNVLPSMADNLRVSSDGRIGTTVRTHEVAPDGILEHVWTVTEGDPAGVHELQPWIDGAPMKTFRFTIR